MLSNQLPIRARREHSQTHFSVGPRSSTTHFASWKRESVNVLCKHIKRLSLGFLFVILRFSAAPLASVRRLFMKAINSYYAENRIFRFNHITRRMYRKVCVCSEAPPRRNAVSLFSVAVINIRRNSASSFLARRNSLPKVAKQLKCRRQTCIASESAELRIFSLDLCFSVPRHQFDFAPRAPRRFGCL